MVVVSLFFGALSVLRCWSFEKIRIGFGGLFIITIIIIKSHQNSIGNYLGRFTHWPKTQGDKS